MVRQTHSHHTHIKSVTLETKVCGAHPGETSLKQGLWRLLASSPDTLRRMNETICHYCSKATMVGGLRKKRFSSWLWNLKAQCWATSGVSPALGPVSKVVGNLTELRINQRSE